MRSCSNTPAAIHSSRRARPAVSQHLKVLKDAGVVIDRPDGTRRLYELNPDGMGALRTYFERFWTQALTSFKHRVEQQEDQ